MKYALEVQTSGDHPTIELAPEMYQRLKKARAALSRGLAIEEQYEIVVLSYLDFETEILTRAAHAMLRRTLDYEEFFTGRVAFNRRLLSLFTAARLYIDAFPTTVAAISGTGEKVATLLPRERAANFEFAFMEALRNHAQHRGLPVHWVGHNYSTDGVGQQRQLVYSVTLAAEKDPLLTDKKFVKSLLKNSLLERMPEKVDLQNAAKIYIEGISRIHAAARVLVDRALVDSRRLIEDTIDSYGKLSSGKTIGLCAVGFDGNEIVETVPLFLNWDDIRIKLSKRNPELVNLRIRHVSGGSRTQDG